MLFVKESGGPSVGDYVNWNASVSSKRRKVASSGMARSSSANLCRLPSSGASRFIVLSRQVSTTQARKTKH